MRLVTTGMQRMRMLLVITLVMAMTSSVSCQSPDYVDSVFATLTPQARIKHVTVNKATGGVYVGAVNVLYQLSPQLDLLYTAETGPQQDNANCEPPASLPPPADWCGCHKTKDCELKETNSVTKSLVVDEEGKRLIVCFSLYQGYCEKRSLANIRDRDLAIYTAQVPNDATSSTVMFIAPGPQPLGRVLYVAAERSTSGGAVTSLSIYKDLVPAVCSRNLSSFSLAFQDFRSSTRKNVESLLRDSFRIHYVHGFASGDYSYFLMVQKDTVDAQSDANYGTHMARVCQRDDRYYSYTEIPLRCVSSNGTVYNLLRAAAVGHAGAELAQSLGLSHVPPLTDVDQVLVGVFSRSAPLTRVALNDSAVCLFTMRSVRSKFTATIQDCFQGKGNTGPPHIVQQQPCTATSYRIDDNYCGAHDMNTPISTSVPLEAKAVVLLPGVNVTAVALTSTHDYTVALVGTQHGSLLKVVLEPGSKQPSGVVYETVDVETGSGLLQDISIVSQNTTIVATANKVYKVRLQACSRFSTCETCHASGDPFCGWCSLTDRCGPKAECVGAVEPLQWLPYNTVSCPLIGAVSPPQTQISKQTTTDLRLAVLNLPVVRDAEFQCSFTFNGVSRITGATLARDLPRSTNISLLCATPPFNLLPPFPTGEDHVVVSLSVRMNKKNHVSTDFTFFDCNQHKSCTKCTSSRFPCTWCVQQHRCTSDRESCGSDILITGTSVPGVSDHPGPAYCPRIDLSSVDNRGIVVFSDSTRAVRVQGYNLQSFQNNLRCRFNGGQDIAAGRLTNDVIECKEYKFQYQGPMGTFNVPLQVVWGEGYVLDNPSNVQVKVYKCEGLAPSCGQCLTVDAVYGCGWCDNTRCTVQSQCTSRNWLDTSATCPNPTIASFSPDNGPRNGGTQVTINGTNLGKTVSDIRDGVTVGGVKCQPVEELYQPSIRIVCVTGARVSSGADIVKVVVTGDDRYTARSADSFSYVEPRIEGFEPRYGPQSGGSLVTIRGTYLNTGTNVKVTLAGLNCAMIRRSKYEIVCKTSPASSADLKGYLALKFDNDMLDLYKSRSFVYVSDPVVSSVVPLTSIASGGIPVTVTGTNLHVVQRPLMVIYAADGSESYSTCDHVNNVTLICWTPTLGSRRVQRRTVNEVTTAPSQPQQQHVAFGFVMDDVMGVRQMSGQMLTVFPDPQFDPFPETNRVKVYLSQNEYLTINGRNLHPVFSKDNLTVKIGDRRCEVTSVSLTQLTCKPPEVEPGYSGFELTVTVEAGRNVSVVIGALIYDGHKTDVPMLIIILIGVIALFVLIIVVFICLMYRYKSRQKDRRLRHMMDVMEARVAKECKEAFAELQTDMTEFTSDFSGLSIPFLNYRTFCMRMLFPNEPEVSHPVLTQPIVDYGRRESMQRGLSIFNQLIGNRTFLLLFVRTLEKQPDFSVKSRVRVASLLSAVLQNRMEYHTEILKTLLGDLVDKLMEDHNPKLLLRRTESVAEKMLTNWFSFLLYRFLRECAGEQLFVLFQAIKQQVEKGPVDEITGEARYALSEDKLIRQHFDFKALTLQVLESSFSNSASEQQVTVSVKVLDCDTVSQVKEKIIDTIYKTVPYSQRPTKDQRDLYWMGPRGRMLLQDEDASGSGREEGIRKLNTLADYHVIDGANMFMTERQMAAPNHFNGSMSGLDRSDLGSRYVSLEAIHSSTRNSPSLSRSGPTQVSLPLMADMDDGLLRYHLVKPHGADNHKTGERTGNMVSEIYLTRLLQTKLALQSYVDTLFETLFSTAVRGNALPLAIKYMFDFLDDQAIQHGVIDTEVVHTWKSNCLPLRFWVGVIKNPDHVFDIHKTNIVDSCLSIVAQTFMDSCSMSPHNLGKDSPSSKLLYAKEIPKYKTWVSRYYQDIKQMPAISDQDMAAMLAEESRLHDNDFCVQGALYELYQFASKYHTELSAMLEESNQANILALPRHFAALISAMSSSQSMASVGRTPLKGIIV